MFEYIGYLASVLLAFSLITVNAIKFRWLNIFGCISFMVYGFLIHAYPVIIANTVLLGINIYQLIRMYKYDEIFHLVQVQPEDKIIENFVSFYKKDIKNYFPNYSITSTENKICFFVLRDMAIANLFVATLTKNGNALVEIDYTEAKYRDYKTGNFIFFKEKESLLQKGIRNVVYENVFNKKHLDFIKVMGFKEQVIDNKNCWVLNLI